MRAQLYDRTMVPPEYTPRSENTTSGEIVATQGDSKSSVIPGFIPDDQLSERTSRPHREQSPAVLMQALDKEAEALGKFQRVPPPAQLPPYRPYPSASTRRTVAVTTARHPSAGTETPFGANHDDAHNVYDVSSVERNGGHARPVTSSDLDLQEKEYDPLDFDDPLVLEDACGSDAEI